MSTENQNGDILVFVQNILHYLELHGLQVEGLFRVSGDAQEIEHLKQMCNEGQTLTNDLLLQYSVHTVAGLFKTYLRELPEPLITFEHYEKFVNILKEQNYPLKVMYLLNLINELPEHNRGLFKAICGFLVKIAANQRVTKMTVESLALIFATNLFRREKETSSEILQNIGHINTIMAMILKEYEFLFLGKESKTDLEPHMRSHRKSRRNQSFKDVNSSLLAMSKSTPNLSISQKVSEKKEFQGSQQLDLSNSLPVSPVSLPVSIITPFELQKSSQIRDETMKGQTRTTEPPSAPLQYKKNTFQTHPLSVTRLPLNQSRSSTTSSVSANLFFLGKGPLSSSLGNNSWLLKTPPAPIAVNKKNYFLSTSISTALSPQLPKTE
eukprot:TRINITY_DN653_c0_g1_i1.p1 TRINITY_DN653_c0_g1~~TRINITY_DN653_c0_g1_i1.p1  ORF type:complete len:381 (-),score=51.25 TRINITY_DN653_c0_g1_i1:182-1324(-)